MALHSDSTLRHVDLFAGSGMFGVALKIAFGDGIRTVCYVEREAYAASTLVGRMEDAALDRAPEWDLVETFDPAEIVGRVGPIDMLSGGFPCQDLSCAGRRAGFGGERSVLFFEILRVASACAACSGGQWPVLCLENVPGIFSSRSSRVFDDPFGEGRVEEVWASQCEELACSIVGRELAGHGYDSVWLPIAAEDVGANHKRKRWWCLAYAKDSIGWGKLKEIANRGWGAGSARSGGELGNASSNDERGDRVSRGHGAGIKGRGSSGELVDASSNDERGNRVSGGHGAGIKSRGSSGELVDASSGRREKQSPSEPKRGAESGCGIVADAGDGFFSVAGRGSQGRDGAGSTGEELGDTEHGGRGTGRESTGRAPGNEVAGANHELGFAAAGVGRPGEGVRQWELPLFAPSRTDPRWEEIIGRRPDVEPAIRRSIDGMDSRVDRLRLCGGGLVPVAGAVALAVLVDFARRMTG